MNRALSRSPNVDQSCPFVGGMFRESPGALNQILNGLMDGVIALAPIRDEMGQLTDCRWLFINSVAEGILGVSARDVLDRCLLDCDRYFADTVLFERLLNLAVKTSNHPCGMVADQSCLSGPVSGWFQLVGVRSQERVIITLRDITLCKDTENRLEISNQRLDALVRQLEEQNRMLARLAAVDGLTQLANRRRLDDCLAVEWLRLYRAQQPLSVVFCDLDHFKAYNDALGHQAGDACLQQVAAALMTVARRPTDLMARYGGEEFAIVLPETDIEGAKQVAQNLRDLLSETALPHPGNDGGFVTLSMGIASKVPSDASSAEELLAEADQALYRAKAAGRNRIIVASEIQNLG
ncbi:MAG: diguanylate cyclase [Cyanobacteria bacterium P01_C01_bin.89]